MNWDNCPAMQLQITHRLPCMITPIGGAQFDGNRFSIVIQCRKAHDIDLPVNQIYQLKLDFQDGRGHHDTIEVHIVTQQTPHVFRYIARARMSRSQDAGSSGYRSFNSEFVSLAIRAIDSAPVPTTMTLVTSALYTSLPVSS